MKKTLLSFVIILLYSGVWSQCVSNVNFNTWTQAGQPANGNWSVQNGGTQVYQSVNGSPTFFVSPFDMMNMHVSGTFRTTDSDDDWMGFVFSFLNPMGAIDTFDMWLFDWKQDFQGNSPRGMALSRANGVITNYGPTFNDHTNTPEFTVVANTFGGPGWNRNYNHAFDLYLTYTRAIIYVDGNLIFDHQDCYKPGRFGFYNLSQRDCYYANFQYELYINFRAPDRVCRGNTASLEFVNPCITSFQQYQSLTWDFGDGSPQTTIPNPTIANANVTHVYNTPGTYTATLTAVDATGCTATATRSIVVSDTIRLTPALTPPPCNGGNNGTVAVTASGGFGPYSYTWNGGAATGSTWVGRNAGTYTVTVTDNICNATGTYTLTQPTALTATTSHIDASCGLNNGSVTIAISGGTPPYANVTWAGVAGYTRSNLGAGTYIANFVDANACSAALQYTETVGSLPCGITSNVTKNDVSCFGGTNGSATLNVTGGTPPITITWSNGATGATVSNLAAGTYGYTFTDANPAHTFSGSVVIRQPPTAMVANVATVGVTCTGANNGQAIASVTSGGVTPFTYNWSGGHPNAPTVSNLSPGNISVTIIDNIGCSASATGTVSNVAQLTATLTPLMDSCYHNAEGSITATVSGGTAPYEFEWSNFSQDSTASNLIAGTYNVTITDYSGCSITRSATVTGPNQALTANFTVQHVACKGQNTGAFNVTAGGGTPGYTYAWTPNTLSGTNPTGLAAGIYSFTITDNFGCRAFGIDTLLEPDSALVATSSHTNVSCPGLSDGSLTISVNGGVIPYTFQGQPVPAGTTTIPGFPAGTYGGNLVDSNGCFVTLSEIITEPGPQSLDLTVTDVSCNGGTDGTATANFINSTGPVVYDWNPGGVLPASRNGLAPMVYTVIATDSNNCTVSASDTIFEPAPLLLNLTIVDAPCFGDSGTVTANHSGAGPFNYNWSGGFPDQQTINPPQGTYAVSATDMNGCLESATFTVNMPSQLQLQSQQTNVSCFGGNDGSINLSVSGGTGSNYTYTWTPSVSTDSTANSLIAGSYTIAIYDQQNCFVDTTIDITEMPALVTDSLVANDVSCFGMNDGNISIYVSGGTGVGTYSYVWNPTVSNTNSATGLQQGSYDVVVTDANSCTISATASVSEPSQLSFTQTQTDLSCYNAANGTASVTVSGGTPVYNYIWSPNVSSGSLASNLSAGTYDLTMSDAHSCSLTTTFTLTQPSQIVVNESSTNNPCFGDAVGSITLSVSGGFPSYTYQWNPSVSTTDSAMSLTAGVYVYTVTDSTNCFISDSVTITEPPLLSLTATETDVLCFGESTGTVTAIATGGTLTYSFSLTNDGVTFQPSSSGQYTGLVMGSYDITVTDANSCSATASVVVNEPTLLTSTISSTDITCFGYDNGIVTANGTGGVPTYTYSFSNGDQNTTGVITDLIDGTYNVTITDANNCSVTATADVIEPVAVTIATNPTVIKVALGETVTINTTTNQNGPLTYTWAPDNGLSCIDCANPVFSGNYSLNYRVTVTTAAGCTGTSEVQVTVNPEYEIFFPSAFTPNGDAVNQFWTIFTAYPASIKQIRVKVFNRIGEKVFESTDLQFGWDGTYKGQDAPPGVYSYVAQIVWMNNHSDSDYKGTVTLLR